ncbi:hypothetical protein EC973_007389, partial [Apophysomyces ossiformis]
MQDRTATAQISYPQLNTIEQRIYTLVEWLVSSKPAGKHFWSICSIEDQIIKIDNTMQQASVVKQNLHGKTKNTVFV